MIKIETLGMLDVAKNNPTLKYDSDVSNYSFLTIDNEVYFISNTMSGDDYGKGDGVIPTGQYLNGFLVKAWEGQKLVIDGKHIEDKLSTLKVGDVLAVQSNGGLKKAASGTGVHLVITDVGITLTEAAVKAKVVVAAPAATPAS